MARSVTLQGAGVKVYISGKLCPEVQFLTYTIDYGEDAIYGIDSQMAQEIAPTRLSVQGSVNGVRLKLTGGLQGYEARTRINEILHAPYTSLRVHDMRSDRDILWLPQMKVTSETIQIQAKSTVKLNFNFKGVVPYGEIDIDG
jgi:hypothetical protein